MKSSPTKCDYGFLQRSLTETLSEEHEEQLAEHLTSCKPCREYLQSLVAGGSDWSRIERALRNETITPPNGPAASQSTLLPRDASQLKLIHSIGAEIQPTDFAVDFLEPSTKADSIGRLNNIEIRSIIGHGGNGIVLQGHQEELNRLVAVKVMAPQLATSAAARLRFAREAQATAAIVHPNVMPILTVHSNGQLPYLVMPYVDCESLQHRLDREGALPVLDVLRIAHQVANGLAAAHAQGLVHRDVKPANILLEKGVDRVMLTDFGLARAVDDATLTRSGLIAGTPQYMSPEQARGEAVDKRSDLFSLGSVMYAMCTGRPPFRAETSYGILRRVTDDTPRSISELNSDIPAWLTGFVSRLQQKSADDRLASSHETAELLEKCVAHVQQPNANPLPEKVQQMHQRSVFRWHRPAATVAVVLGLLGVLLIAARPLWDFGQPTNTSGTEVKSSKAMTEVNDARPRESPADTSASSLGISEGNIRWDDGISTELNQLDAELNDLLQMSVEHRE